MNRKQNTFTREGTCHVFALTGNVSNEIVVKNVATETTQGFIFKHNTTTKVLSFTEMLTAKKHDSCSVYHRLRTSGHRNRKSEF